MTLVRWDAEVNRLVNSLFDTPTTGRAAATRRWIPALDLVETAEQFVLRADLPGLGEDDVTIEVEDRVLTLTGERKAAGDDAARVRLERPTGRFQRTVTLPEGVDAGGIDASFVQGVLEVRIPKPVARKPHRVAITVGQPAHAVVEGEPASDTVTEAPAA